MPTTEVVSWTAMMLVLVCCFLSYLGCSKALHDDYMASVEDARHAPRNLESVLGSPTMVDELIITGQRAYRSRDITLEAILDDGRWTCLARCYEDIPVALTKLQQAGVDISKVEAIFNKMAAWRATRAK